MPKNMGKGGNKRKKGKKILDFERELLFKTPMQEYGQILRLLGDSRLEIQCIDGIKRIGHIRGKIKKKIWMTTGDVVLVALREFEKEKCDVLIKYTEDEVRKLKALKEVPDNIKVPEAEQSGVTNDLQEENFFGYEKEVVDDKKKGKKDEYDFDDDDESDDDWLNNRMMNIRGNKKNDDEEEEEEEEEEEDDKQDEEDEEDDETEEEAVERERLRKLEIDNRIKQEKEKKEQEARDKETLKEIEKNKKVKDSKPQKAKGNQKDDKKDKINIDDI
jgi:translation initiation factor 1A